MDVLSFGRPAYNAQVRKQHFCRKQHPAKPFANLEKFRWNNGRAPTGDSYVQIFCTGTREKSFSPSFLSDKLLQVDQTPVNYLESQFPK